jgi:ABC-type dipeptide/oligopeptide/nickel transport system permease component
MVRFVARRLLYSILVLWGVATVAFLIVHLASAGNPVRQALGIRATPAVVAQVEREYGLNQPILHQYVTYLTGLIHGHLGYSLALSAPVGSVLSQRVMPSLLLVCYSMIIAVAIGVPLGIASAVQPGSKLDHGIRLVTTFSFGMPAFWVGLMLALLLGQDLHLFPVSGYQSGLVGELKTLTLPALTLGFSLVVIVTRTLRANLIEVLSMEYIEAARSRGMSQSRILLRHALRNAVTPTIAILAALVGFLLSGTVVIESVFQIPGVGSLLVHSIVNDDFAMVQAIALVSAGAVVLAGLLAEVCQSLLDPRVRITS